MKNFEQELKLQLDEREFSLLGCLADSKPQLQTNYYFTMQNMSSEVMVRLREKGGNYLLCYKSRLSQREGVSVCDERECEVDGAFADSMIKRGILPDEINGMLKTHFGQTLHCAGNLQTYRTAFTLGEWKLELDKNVYLGRCDYELECESDDVEALEKLKLFLFYNYGIFPRYSRPKSQRFFEALNEKV